LRKRRGTVNYFRRSGWTRPNRRNGFNFTRRRKIQRWFQARANEQKQFNMPWNLPRENFAAKQSKPPRRKDAIRAKKMTNPNPFVPQGSVLEQNKRRSRMKLAVFCVLAVSVCGLTAMLIQGCKREQTETPPPAPEPVISMTDTNLSQPMVSTGAPPALVSTSAPPPAYTPPVAPVVPEAAGSEYVVVKGDSLAKIAKNKHVTLKALEAANLGVVPTKLKVGQKLTIPAGAAVAPVSGGTAAGTEMTGAPSGGGETYVVKSGDTLTKIAKAHGVSLKALEAANPNVDPSHIKVGHKLQIPAKVEAATPAPAPVEAPAAPAAAPVTSPVPAGTPTGR
jgi:LysM repeat protein